MLGKRQFKKRIYLIFGLLFVLALIGILLLPGCLLQRVNGSFLQLYNKQNSRTVSEWESLFKQAHAMGMREFIIQWTVYDESLFYAKSEPYSESSLFKIIKAAEKTELKLTLGLNYETKFWQALQSDDSQLAAYLSNHAQKQLDELPSLIATVNEADPDGKTVIAWYLSDEIDDQNWQTQSRQVLLTNYLQAMVQGLKNAKPNWPIYISTFSSGQVAMDKVALWYRFFFALPGLDRILFQDSVGTGVLDLKSLKTYLETIHSELKADDYRFSVISELFAIDRGALKLASVKRLRSQLKLANRFSENDIILFSFFPYIVSDESKYNLSELHPFWQEQLERCDGFKKLS